MDKKVLGLIVFCFLPHVSPKYTELKVFNPYSSVSIKLLIKCDHDYRTKKYRFYKTIIIKRRSGITIRAPMGLKKCEIWPIDMKLFGDLKER